MMKIMPEIAIDIGANLRLIEGKMNEAYTKALKIYPQQKAPTLVAVSKTKSVIMIKRAYDQGQRHFGENYVKELLIKVKDRDLASLCPDIKWHYIGAMQSSKISAILRLPNLHMLQTIHSKEIASSIDKRWKKDPLNVMLQVNTSGEEAKHGITPSQCCDIASHVLNNCNNLKFCGLMTIGSWEHSYSDGENPDFITLVKCRDEVSEKLNIPKYEIPMSMGMSADYEQGIISGSTYVRVGSKIFGARDYVQNNTNNATAADSEQHIQDTTKDKKRML